jgi:hypothetical protein
MAVFISVTTNAFEEEFSRRQNEGRPSPRNLNIRRPLRGIEIKEDTYATMKVIDSVGRDLPLINSSSPSADEQGVGVSDHYANFIITMIQEVRVEKSQIVETFGEDFIFFFGERPRTLNIQGVVFNTNDFNWKSEFWENYENNLRGTRLLENNARLYLYFDDVVVEGYILTATMSMSAETPYHLPLQFQLFVTNYAFLSNVGSVTFPGRSFQEVPEAEFTADSTNGRNYGLSVASDAITATALPSLHTGGGGLNSFLASAAQFQTSASFSIQSTLETIKNTFYGRSLVIPRGIGNQVVLPPIDRQARFQPPPGGESGHHRVPIHQMRDEYIEQGPTSAQFDEAELERVRGELRLRTPDALEAEARRQLLAAGIDPTRPNTNYLLLGRAAFAGLQVVGSFGMRQADGAIDVSAAI